MLAYVSILYQSSNSLLSALTQQEVKIHLDTFKKGPKNKVSLKAQSLKNVSKQRVSKLQYNPES